MGKMQSCHLKQLVHVVQTKIGGITMKLHSTLIKTHTS